MSTFNRTRPMPSSSCAGVEHASLDLTNKEQCDEFARTWMPDAVIHLAALTNTSACEKDPELADRTNCPTWLVGALVSACPRCIFLFASTDLVYPGTHPPYAPVPPELLPAALNVYGRSKQKGESLVLSSLPNSLVFRLSNMIGTGGGKFYDFLHASLSSRKVVGLRVDERRSFVAADDVAALFFTAACGLVSKEAAAQGGGVGAGAAQGGVGAGSEAGSGPRDSCIPPGASRRSSFSP